MKAIILVGGEGVRMRPLTNHIPKPLLPIANVSFLERQIGWLKAYGIDEVTLSLGYLPDAFQDYFKEHPIPDVRIDYVVESEPLGTAGAIKFAAGKPDGDILVCNGDVLTDLNIDDLVSFHKSRSAIATIALTYVEDPSAFGVVPTHDNGEVIAFVEKPPKENAPSHWINAGIYILAPEFLELITSDLKVSIERETFPVALQKGSMFALESDAYWLDIGTPSKYLQANADMLHKLGNVATSKQYRQIAPNLFSDGEVQIGENVIIKSMSLVGGGSTIGDDCVLDGATLGAKCTVEKGTKISYSVLFPGVKVSAHCDLDNCVVGDLSDIGENVTLCGETLVGFHEKIEANARLEGERVGSVV